MKDSTKNQAKGAFKQLEGTIKVIAGKLRDDEELEAEGSAEKLAGKVQQKIAQVEKVVGQ